MENGANVLIALNVLNTINSWTWDYANYSNRIYLFKLSTETNCYKYLYMFVVLS